MRFDEFPALEPLDQLICLVHRRLAYPALKAAVPRCAGAQLFGVRGPVVPRPAYRPESSSIGGQEGRGGNAFPRLSGSQPFSPNLRPFSPEAPDGAGDGFLVLGRRLGPHEHRK